MVGLDLGIVGASFAGLSCARAAAARGLRTVVYDRKPRPGARIRTTGRCWSATRRGWSLH